MDPLEEGAVHQAMPQGTIDHGAQTSEEAQLAMRVKEEVIAAIPTGRKTESLRQRAMMLKRGIHATQNPWPQPLNL